jgi:hypothetical protein
VLFRSILEKPFYFLKDIFLSIMPSDPCWLPSAIMQTTAALVGFYAVVYVFMSQFVHKLKENRDIPDNGLYSAMRLLDRTFVAVTILGILTIFLNYLWLDSLSTQIFFVEASRLLKASAASFFIGMLFTIGLYSYFMVTKL